MLKRDLLALLVDVGDDENVVIAGAPDVTNWINEIVPALGRATDSDGCEHVVLGATENSVGSEEADVSWPIRPI